jgi:hypothetical protein
MWVYSLPRQTLRALYCRGVFFLSELNFGKGRLLHLCVDGAGFFFFFIPGIRAPFPFAVLGLWEIVEHHIRQLRALTCQWSSVLHDKLGTRYERVSSRLSSSPSIRCWFRWLFTPWGYDSNGDDYN